MLKVKVRKVGNSLGAILPGDLRRKLEPEANRKGVSLNQLILQKIA